MHFGRKSPAWTATLQNWNAGYINESTESFMKLQNATVPYRSTGQILGRSTPRFSSNLETQLGYRTRRCHRYFAGRVSAGFLNMFSF